MYEYTRRVPRVKSESRELMEVVMSLSAPIKGSPYETTKIISLERQQPH